LLDRPVDDREDHILGPADAALTLVEYGSYACPYCRAVNDDIAALRSEFGDRLRYVFRHRPLTGSDIARRAAELVERADTPERFWAAHMTLMTRSATLSEDDLRTVAQELLPAHPDPQAEAEARRRARERVERDERSARASGVRITPTFYINGRRYDGPWDRGALADALLGSLGHRVRTAALDFASWAPSSGVLLLIATLLAIALTNSAIGPAFEALWQQPLGLSFGEAAFRLSLRDWINDGLLSVFFLVVGLEIKREFTVGHLATRQSAALPVAAALGGMAMPVLIYRLIVPEGPWAHGWGVPMATDTAFAIALIAMMGARVPVELRIFLTAAAIADDIGAILVVAAFYSTSLRYDYLGGALAIVALLAVLAKLRIYSVWPYLLLGAGLWICVHAGGLHASLAGVVLAMCIPTRPPANLDALMTQAQVLVAAEARRSDEVLRHGPSTATLRALDDIHDRIESPADRMLRRAGPRSSYVVLPLFALANAGVSVETNVGEHGTLRLAIAAGLVAGKPLGMLLASMLAVRLRLAVKPDAYTWRQLTGAGALAGIGFTMSLFIAAQAFPQPADFTAAKLAVFAASVSASVIGVAMLWNAKTDP